MRNRLPSALAALNYLRQPWCGYLIAGTVLCVLYVSVPPFRGSGPVINGIGLSGVLAVVIGTRRYAPAARLAWSCFALALFLFWLGDVYTYSYPKLVHAAVPFPSVGDGFYLTFYPVLMLGLLLLVRRRNKGAEGPGLIDSLIMSLGLSLVSGVLLIAPYAHDASLPLLPKLVSIAYPMGDIILLAAIIRLAVDSGKRRPAFFLLSASTVTLLITDFVHGLLTLHNGYHHQLALGAGWIFFYLLWGAGALHPSMRDLDQAGGHRQPRLSPLRLAVLSGSSLIAPGLEMVKIMQHDNADLQYITGASGVLFCFVVLRMDGLIRAREKSVSRESALTAAGGMLVAAASRQEIIAAALRAAVDLAPEATIIRMCLILPDRMRVLTLREDDSLTEWMTAGNFARSLHTDGDLAVSAALRFALRLPAETESLLALPIEVQGETDPAVLVVAGEQATAGESRNALRTLGTQVALALESAGLSEEVHRRASEERLSSLVQNSSDLITVLDASLNIVYQSPSIERVLGYTADEVTGRSFELLLPTSERARLSLRLTDGSVRGRSEVIECLLAHRDGSVRHFEILHTNLLDDPAVRGIVLNGRDVSERKAFEEQLSHQAFHDSVTHLANRALFNERVRHAVARARREHISLAVIFVDLDDFKTVNDSLGHAAGDTVLREVAKRLSLNIRAADTAARFGGDEFAVLLEDVEDPQSAADTAERILAALRQPVPLDQKEIAVHASLGISVAEAGTPTDADELIRNADAAMYIAKAEGKGGYRMFEPAMHERVLARLELRGDLERAVERGEFEVHYQPLVRLEDDVVSGVEALLRWRHPTRGLVPPDQFVPFAEETGLIIPIGRWVLHQGCRQAKILQQRLGELTAPTVSINLSVKQLFNSDIAADVAATLEEFELDPSALTLEITESVMMTDTELAVRRLTELRDLGVRLAMDDFGTGYSSLSYLSRFPLDVLKMDRSLLADGESPVMSGLASAVLGLGETFALEVVAEGIEFSEQSQTLKDLGCEVGQGFYFARPMDAESLVDFLEERVASAAGGAHAGARA